MDADAQVADVAALLADSSRTAILWVLSDGRALPACDLGLEVGIKAPTVSHHLTKLINGGLVKSEKHGRHRYYRLANLRVVALLETLATFAPPARAKTFRQGQRAKSLRFARTCYDHLAGRLGVEITETLVRMRHLELSDRDFVLSSHGSLFLEQFGVDIHRAQSARRSFARCCLDWSERRYHLAGSLGSALLDRLFDVGWIKRGEIGRAVLVTPEGQKGFLDWLDLSLGSK